MKTLVSKILFGRDRFTGLIATGIIALFVLGCTCGKNFDLGNIGKDSNSSRPSDNSSRTSTSDKSNTSSDNPFGDSTDETDSDIPSSTLTDALVKDTTAQLANAISTEDFSSIYSDSSPDFKKTYTEDQMKGIFKSYIENKSAVLPIMAKAISMDPEYTTAPHLRNENGLSILVTSGKYSTSPAAMQFDYEYVNRNDKWKLLKLVVKLGK